MGRPPIGPRAMLQLGDPSLQPSDLLVSSDVLRDISECVGLSLYGDASEAIKDAAMAGKLKCRGFDPRSFETVAIEAAEWAHLEISAEGEVLNLRLGVVVYENVVVELRGLRRLFPRSSGRGGTSTAEIECRAWLIGLAKGPRRRKADVREEARRAFGDRLGGDGFDRAWKACVPKEWKGKGRPSKPVP
jgi:hypothetical protein